jgi:hypothetical protein
VARRVDGDGGGEQVTAVASKLFSEPVTVISVAEAPGDDGRPVETITGTVEVLGAYRHRASIDTLDDGLVLTDEMVLYLPPQVASIGAGDRVVVKGDEYEVVSTGFPQTNFRTTAVHHVEVRARRSQR